MGIQSSLFSGVSGLNANGNAMTVVGNNIANSNTIGFKSSRTVFADMLSASVSGSSGTSQIGRGVSMSTVDNIFSQGTFENTESNTDLAIEGAGFFMVRDPLSGTVNYTRAGAFSFDESGMLVNPEGYAVQGYFLDPETGMPKGDVTDMQVETRTFSPANPTTNVVLATNLNANAPYLGTEGDGESPFDITNPAETSNYASSVRIFDSLGVEHLVTTYFNKLDPAGNPTDYMQWEAHVVVTAADVQPPEEIALRDAALATAETTLQTAETTLAAAETALQTAQADLDAIDPVADPAGYAAAEAIRDAALVARDAALVARDAAMEDRDTQKAAAADWVEVSRSMLTFDTNGRLINVTDMSNGTGGWSAYDTLDRTNNFILDPVSGTATGNLYQVSDAGEALPNTTDTEVVNTTPKIGTVLDAANDDYGLTWINESDNEQQIFFTFNATQYSSESDVVSQSQDGYATGTLVSLSIDNDGNILGNYSNGEPRKLGRIALAKFSNPLGLIKAGYNMYTATDQSGTPIIGTVGSGVGRIYTNSLEMSNVDLAQEFVKMITTQRGFQANSKIITTTDEMLGELINLKR
ncbi:flagellar hook protein FlgE [Desulfuromonas thiophila]|uniref:flagellar hook protein FlgE n=1 Tax=Desulfuromonas thiophila TaxID=57664 RepID=UPI0029F46A55|nr:flagellar hook protein FlgE [Desulfuromonas thiophila]